MRATALPAVAFVVMIAAGCAQTPANQGASSTSDKVYGIYRNPHGYCRLAKRNSEFEADLKRDFWRSMGYYASAEEACKRLGARGCDTDERSCTEPPE